ncbi:MAG: bacteriophage Gp15 family protein [Oscillospiraceae bacterium]|nr:bacteriophage Gp15 family protein [Oscillospiraceae bacterium]
MINILYESYPTSVTIDNKVYQILTDFRDWISFSEMISDTSVSKEDKLLFMLSWFPGEKPPVTAEMIKQLVSFFAVKEDISADVTENYSGRQKHPSFSFKYDAAYVLSDFLRYYQINLSHIEYLHWWEFQSLFKGLPDESQTKKRISYRTTNLEEISDKKERKRIRKIKLALRLPSTEIDDEDIGAVFSSCM